MDLVTRSVRIAMAVLVLGTLLLVGAGVYWFAAIIYAFWTAVVVQVVYIVVQLVNEHRARGKDGPP